MKIFVTGVEGYIGALLAPMLEERGHEVVGTDTGYYRDGWLYSEAYNGTFPRFINKDLRRITQNELEGFDSVVHLAELSNDPLGQNNPALTLQINHQGTTNLASRAKAVGISRFIYTSSCSVDGQGSGDFLTEAAPVNPQTTCAICKVNVERDVGAMADDRFSPVFLRNATAYGPSPRMRFDIVLNKLSAWAWTAKKIVISSDGTPWRPLVHVHDICNAIVCSLDAPREAVHNQTFNVGHNGDNYRVREIAEIVGNSFPGYQVTPGPSAGDNRRYRVNFDMFHRQLPGFRCDWDARKGAPQLRELFERIDMPREISPSHA